MSVVLSKFSNFDLRPLLIPIWTNMSPSTDTWYALNMVGVDQRVSEKEEERRGRSLGSQ